MINTVREVTNITNRIDCNLMGHSFHIKVKRDDLNPIEGRIYIQMVYSAPCTKDTEVEQWKGRKWYLSEYMTEDEVVKTCYAAFKAAVDHEVMEGFKVDGTILFNPHVNFEELLKISHKEIKRINYGSIS